MTDYSLWEVILNGDSPIPSRVVDGVVQPVAPTTAEQRLAKKNKLKARGTLLIALLDKNQLKFNIHKDAKSLMEAIEKRFGGNKETKKIYEAEVKSSSSTSPTTQNIAFVSSQNTDSTNESVSAVTSVSAASNKVLVSALPNVDNLKEIDLKWQMAMLTMRARRFLQRTGRNLGANGTTSIGFDMSKVECYNCHRRWHFTREYRYDWSFQADEEPTNYALMAFTSSSSSSFDNEVAPCSKACSKAYSTLQSHYDKLTNDLRKSHIDVLLYKIGTFMPPKPDLVFYDAHTDHKTITTVLNVEPSTTKPNKDLSQSNMPSAHIIEDWASDSEDESEGEPISTQKAPSFVQTSKHVKTPRTFVKPVEHPTPAAHLRKDIPKTRVLTRSRLVSLTAARPITTAVPQTKVSHYMPAKHVVNKAYSPIRRTINLIPSPKNCKFHQKVTTVKANQVNAVEGVKGNWEWKPKCPVLDHVSRHTSNPQHALKDKGVIDSGCSRHMTKKISYLFEFEEINRGYVAFGGNPKGGKITCKSKIRTDIKCIILSFDFKLPEENHVLFRVSRENNMYNVGLKNIVPLGDLTCLFAKATLDESNLWYRRLGQINFKTINKLVKGNLVRGLPSKVFKNNHTCVAYKKGKQYRASWNQPNSSAGIQENLNADPQNTDAASFEVMEPESVVHVSPNSYDKPKKHDDKTKREAKGKSLIELSTGVRDLRDKFEEFFDNSTNGVNAASTPVIAVGPNSTNNTNTFSAVGPSNNVVGLKFKLCGKSSFVDPSQYPDDPDMPALEDITCSNDEEDVGAEADFSNLETNITEESIDYEEVFAPVTRIEAMRLFLAYAFFMGFMVYQMDVKSTFLYGTIKEEVYVCQPLGFVDPDYPDKVYKVVKALYGLHQAPRAWYETLANYLLENGFQRGKIDQTLFIKKQKDGKSASTPIDTKKPLLKDPNGEDVDVYTYKSMIGSLMYLTSSRPDIMFAVCACARFQVTPKASHLHAVKRIFRYLKGKPHLGLWYPKDSPFNLVAYSDSDYAEASIDRNSTTGGCQFLGCRLISWQCKVQTVVATSSTEAEYVDAASCCAQIHSLDCVFLGFGLTMEVNKSSMKLLEWTLHVTNVSSAG
nr:hypothetical protein [Tanacetum cinerariifolium]